MGLMPLFGGSMSFSVNTPVSDGVVKQFAITFSNGIFSRASVFVYVEDDVDGAGDQLERSYTWINDGLIELDVVAPAGKVVTIRRIMQKDTPAVDFVDGAILDEQNLDEQADHLLNTMHEVLDGYGAENINTDVNMNGHKLTNVFTDINDPESIATVRFVQDNAGDAQDAQEAAELAAAQSQASAVASSNSASAALVSENAADISAVAADDTLKEFDGKWYGAAGSDPLTDPNGDASTTGDTYWNTSDSALKVYNGTMWEDTASAINTIRQEVSFTTAQGQTVFAVIYDVGYLEVYYNGVRLLDGIDFLATDGTTFVLTDGVASDLDYITAVAFGSFDVLTPEATRTALDVYSKAETDTGRKNYLINGNFSIWQRGESIALGGVSQYVPDRFKVTSGNGGNKTVSRVSSTATELNAGAPVNYMQIEPLVQTVPDNRAFQYIEGLELATKIITVSGRLYVDSDLAFSIGLRTYSDATNHNDATSLVETFTAGAWHDFAFTLSVPDVPNHTIDSNAAVLVIFDFDDLNVNHALADLQVELGSVATPFEYVSAGDNLAACQRYYCETTENRDMAPLGVSGGNETVRTYVWSYPIPMRAIPTITTTVAPGTASATLIGRSSVSIRSTGLTSADTAVVLAGTSADAEL